MRAPLGALNIVIATAGVDAELMSLRHELRMVKAALLYADTVTLATPKIALRERVARSSPPGEEYRRRVEESGITRKPGWQQAYSILHGAHLQERALSADEQKLVMPFAEDFAELQRLRAESSKRALDSPEQTELARALESGAVVLNSLDFGLRDPAQHADAVADEFEDLLAEALDGTSGTYPLFDEVAWLTVAPAVHKAGLTARDMAPANQAALATRLIVDQVEAYADAEIDVLLDVRDRLAAPLARFRAAMASASQEIQTIGFDERFEGEARAVFSREVQPALVELQDGLTDLGARASLRRAAEPAVQWLLVGAAGAAALTELRSAAISAAGGLLAAVGGGVRAELQHSREVHRRQLTNSYFFLWRANQLIRPPS